MQLTCLVQQCDLKSQQTLSSMRALRGARVLSLVYDASLVRSRLTKRKIVLLGDSILSLFSTGIAQRMFCVESAGSMLCDGCWRSSDMYRIFTAGLDQSLLRGCFSNRCTEVFERAFPELLFRPWPSDCDFGLQVVRDCCSSLHVVAAEGVCSPGVGFRWVLL